jgi:hypothetical protein
MLAEQVFSFYRASSFYPPIRTFQRSNVSTLQSSIFNLQPPNLQPPGEGRHPCKLNNLSPVPHLWSAIGVLTSRRLQSSIVNRPRSNPTFNLQPMAFVPPFQHSPVQTFPRCPVQTFFQSSILPLFQPSNVPTFKRSNAPAFQPSIFNF